MKRFDAIVIGGGPAGSTCAHALGRAGMQVALLDRKPFPRDKVCAGWVTPEVLTTLGIDHADYGRERVLQPIRAFRTGLVGVGGAGAHAKGHDAAITTHYDSIVSYGIRRCEFDDYLVRRSGAELLFGEPLTTLHRTQNEWHVNGRWRAPLLIGAGGHYCPVARHLGADLGQDEQPVTAQEVEFALTEPQQRDCVVRGDTPELYFCRDLRGYGWCFRKGHWLNIGLGREGGGTLAPRVSDFIAFLQQQGRIPAGLPRMHGHAYLLHRRPAPRPRTADGVLLIGDAAGLAYPQSGEGIRPAVESALLAAEHVASSQGDYSHQQLAQYEARLQARLGPGEPGGTPGTLQRVLGRWLLGNRLFTRHVVLDRWFLHRHQPALNG
jgi:geranylgeranyl reductase family protein